MSTTSTHFLSAIDACSFNYRSHATESRGRAFAPSRSVLPEAPPRSTRPVARRRPAGRPVPYGARPAVGYSGAHPLTTARYHDDSQEIGIGGLAIAALTTFLVVAALFGLAHLRAGTSVAESRNTAVVEVLDGESLSELARRVAPDASVGGTVDRIVSLNDMTDAGLWPGQLLVVPAFAQ